MLKISIVDTSAQRRIVLEGQLIAPWMTELKQTWNGLATDVAGRELVIDVENLTFINREGENALLELMQQGAKFRCRGVFTKHIVQQLVRRHKRSTSAPFPCQSAGAEEEKGQK